MPAGTEPADMIDVSGAKLDRFKKKGEPQMSYSLNSLKGDYIGGNTGGYYRGY